MIKLDPADESQRLKLAEGTSGSVIAFPAIQPHSGFNSPTDKRVVLYLPVMAKKKVRHYHFDNQLNPWAVCMQVHGSESAQYHKIMTKSHLKYQPQDHIFEE